MARLNLSVLNLDGSEDDHALKYLAGSLLAHWRKLPDDVREEIYTFAVQGRVTGLPQTVQLKEQIDRLIRRNVRDENA